MSWLLVAAFVLLLRLAPAASSSSSQFSSAAAARNNNNQPTNNDNNDGSPWLSADAQEHFLHLSSPALSLSHAAASEEGVIVYITFGLAGFERRQPVAMSLVTAEALWQTDIDGLQFARPTWMSHDASLVFFEIPGLLAVNATTGKLAWKHLPPKASESGCFSLPLGDGNILSSCGFGELAVLDWQTGKVLHKVDTAGFAPQGVVDLLAALPDNSALVRVWDPREKMVNCTFILADRSYRRLDIATCNDGALAFSRNGSHFYRVTATVLNSSTQQDTLEVKVFVSQPPELDRAEPNKIVRVPYTPLPPDSRQTSSTKVFATGRESEFLVVVSGRTVLTLDAATLDLLWTAPNVSKASPLSSHEIVTLDTVESIAATRHLTNGSIVWKVPVPYNPLDNQSGNNPVGGAGAASNYDDDDASSQEFEFAKLETPSIVLSSNFYTLRAIDSKTGKVLWSWDNVDWDANCMYAAVASCPYPLGIATVKSEKWNSCGVLAAAQQQQPQNKEEEEG